MSNFRNFEEFKLKADNEYINDLFYFFKGHVENQEWQPSTEVVFYGLNNEFEEGITLTLGEARDFLKNNYSQAKTEEVANSYAEKIKNIEAWSPPEKISSKEWIPPSQRESVPSSDYDDEIGFDRDIVNDEEYGEIFNDSESESSEDFSTEFGEDELFLIEDFEDDEESIVESSKDDNKDKPKKREKKKVIGEELPFEDDGNHQEEMATERAKMEDMKAHREAWDEVQVLFDEDEIIETHQPSQAQNIQSVEEALNDTISQMNNELESVNQYDEYGEIINPTIFTEKTLSDDINAVDAFQGNGSAGDISSFGKAFDIYSSQMGNDSISGLNIESDIASLLNGVIMGMAFTGSGDQIREPVQDEAPQYEQPTNHTLHGVHESMNDENLGVDSGFVLDEYGNLKSVAQIRAEDEKSNYEIGQDTRDIQVLVDASVADRDAQDALRVSSYNNEIVEMPPQTLLQGEEFNQVYMEHFADANAVEFSAQPIPENVETVDLSFGQNGAVLGYEQFGTVYITAAPISDSESEITAPQVYLHPDSAEMFKDATALSNVNFGDGVADSSFTHNMGGMFLNCENLVLVNADNLNTGSLKNIDGMFANCSSLETVMTSSWDTRNILTASFAFSECSSLLNDPSSNWKLHSLQDAEGFMSGCSNLKYIDTSGWDAKNLTITREMFNGCSTAETININGLQTTNVKDMSSMFKGCENIEDLNLSRLNTSSLMLTDSGHPTDDIFFGCTKLLENDGFKAQASEWALSANRSAELNAPVQLEYNDSSKFESLKIPVVTEIVNKDGSTSQMTSYYGADKSQYFSASSNTMESASVSTKVNENGEFVVTTTKDFADNSKLIQSETITRDGQIIKDVVAYDGSGKSMSEIPAERLADLSTLKKLEINPKNEGQQIVLSVAHENGNAKSQTVIDINKDGKYSSNTVFIGKDGNQTNVNQPTFAGYARQSQSVENTNSGTNNESRRSAKGRDGNIYGTSSSTTARTVYDSAKLKQEKMLYDTGKKIEKLGRDAQPAASAITNAGKKEFEKIVSEVTNERMTQKDLRDLTNDAKSVSKDVVKSIFSVAIASSINFERTEFKKTMNAAQITSGLIGNKKYGISLEDLQKKSQSDIIKELSGLKDSNGKQLLSDKQIKNIAKRREGASDAIVFKEAVTSKSSVILSNSKQLTDSQLKSLRKFMDGNMSKMKPQDVINIADAYFQSNKSSALHGLKIASLSKDAIGEILSGKNPHIKRSDLSERDISILRLAYNTPRKSIKAKQEAKRIAGASFNSLLKLMQKTGSGIAQETSQMIGMAVSKTSMAIRGVVTAISVGEIYGKLALKGVKFSGKLLAKTPPGKIIIKAGGRVKEAIGNIPLGKSKLTIKERAKIRAEKKDARVTKKENRRKAKIDKKHERKNAIKGKVKKGVDKATAAARRTAAGKLALKAYGKMQMIANSKYGKLAAKAGKVIAAPFKLLGFVGRKITAVVQAITKGLQKLMLYAAAGLIAFVSIYIILVLLISASVSNSSTTLSVNTSVMSPPVVNEEDEPVTQDEYDEMWDKLSEALQQEYADSENAKQAILDKAQNMLNETPTDEEGNTIIGWAGEEITEYGVAADMEENDGLWISYEPIADDNSKDAIVLAYMIMGSKDFYYKEAERYQLIEDLIAAMNPDIDSSTANNTVFIDATFFDDDKEIYACRTGCDTLTYYCADISVYDDFSSAPMGKSKNYEGTKSVKDLESCVRLSTDGMTILANEESVPDVDNPVIYADELESHALGDSYTSTCTGDETVTIYYEYKYYVWGDILTYSAFEYGRETYGDDYSGHVKFMFGECTEIYPEHPYGIHYHFYDSEDNLLGYKGMYEMYIEGWKPVIESDTVDVKIKDIGNGYSHASHSYTEGVDDESLVIGPTKEIEITNEDCEDYVKPLLDDDETLITAYVSHNVDSECSSWKVEFQCTGHTINTCPNGHTDLGVTIHQYSIEDFICFGGGVLSLPYNGYYSTYIDAFLENEIGERELELAHNLINQDWATLYGISTLQGSTVENGYIGEAYIYYYLTDKEIGLGFNNAQAAAILGYIKQSSDFKINKASDDRFGLCQWNNKELEKIGRNALSRQPTLLEQIALLRKELTDTGGYCGFNALNNLTEFKGCKNNLLGAKKAAKILAENWECGEIDDVDAVVTAAGEYFEETLDVKSEFRHPRLKEMYEYVTWALEIAQSPEHGYCQKNNVGPPTRLRPDYDCSGFVNAAFTYGAGIAGGYENAEGIAEGMRLINEKPTAELLHFGDLLVKHGSDTECGHVEIYIGKNTSIGAKSNDGDVGCVHMRLHEKEAIWTDHVFHQAGDQGKGWNPGDPYTYDEISASTASFNFYDSYQTYYNETNIITFTVDGTEYQAEEGMTWAKWCDSSYNTDGFFVLNNKITKSGSQFVYGCVSTFAITSGYSYSIQ